MSAAAEVGDDDDEEAGDAGDEEGAAASRAPRWPLSHPARAPVIVRGLVVTLRGEVEEKEDANSILQRPPLPPPRRSGNADRSSSSPSFFGAGGGAAAAARRAVLAAAARPALAAAAAVLPRFPVRVLDARVEHASTGCVVYLAGVELEFRSSRSSPGGGGGERGGGGGESSSSLCATLAISPIEASVAALSSFSPARADSRRVRVASMEASTLELSVSAGGGGAREREGAAEAAEEAPPSSSASEVSPSPPRSPTRRAGLGLGHRRRHSTVDDDVALGRRHLHQSRRRHSGEGDDEGLPPPSEPRPLLRVTRLRLSLGALDLTATVEAAAVITRLCAVAAAAAAAETPKSGEEKKRSKASSAPSSPSSVALSDVIPLLPDSVLLTLPRVSLATTVASTSSSSSSARASAGPLRLSAGRRCRGASAASAASAAPPFLYRASFELGGASVRVSSASASSAPSGRGDDAVDARFGGCGASAVLWRGGRGAAAAAAGSSSSSSPPPDLPPSSLFLETTAKLGDVSASVCPAAAWPLFASAAGAVERLSAADAATRAATERLEEEAEKEGREEEEEGNGRAATTATAAAEAPSSPPPSSSSRPPPPHPPPPISACRRQLLLWSFELDRKQGEEKGREEEASPPFALVSLLAAGGGGGAAAAAAATLSLSSVEARGGSSSTFDASPNSSSSSSSGIRFSARGLELRLGLASGDLAAPAPAPAPAQLSLAGVEAFLRVGSPGPPPPPTSSSSSTSTSSSAPPPPPPPADASPSPCPRTGCGCRACCRCHVAASGLRLAVDEAAVAALAAAVASAAPPAPTSSGSTSLLPPALSRLAAAAGAAAAARKRRAKKEAATALPKRAEAPPFSSSSSSSSSSPGISLEVTDVEAVVNAPRGYDDASAVAVVAVRAGVGEGKDGDGNGRPSSPRGSPSSYWPYGKRPPVATIRSASATLRLERLAASGLGARGGGGGGGAVSTADDAAAAAPAPPSSSFEASALTLVYRETLASEGEEEATSRSVDLLSVASARASLSSICDGGGSGGRSLSVAVSGVRASADAGALLAAPAACRGAAAAAARALTEHCRSPLDGEGGAAAFAAAAAAAALGLDEEGEGRRKKKEKARKSSSPPIAVELSFSDVAVSAALGDGAEWNVRLSAAAARLPPPPKEAAANSAAAAAVSPAPALVVAEIEVWGLGVDLDGEELLGVEGAAARVAERSGGGGDAAADDRAAAAGGNDGGGNDDGGNGDGGNDDDDALPPWAFSGAQGPRERAEAAARASKGLEQDLQLPPPSPSAPASVLAVAVRARGLACRLPHGAEVGRAQRHCELWLKALSESALAPSLQETGAAVAGLVAAARDGLGVGFGFVAAAGASKKKRKKRSGDAELNPPQPPLVEVTLSLDGASLDFEHHPFEAELARTLPAGADTAARAALWARALEGVVGSSGSGSSGSVSTNAGMRQQDGGVAAAAAAAAASGGAVSPTRGGGAINPSSSFSSLSTAALLSPAPSFTASTSPESLAGPLAAAATRVGSGGGGGSAATAAGTADGANPSASASAAATTDPRTAVEASLAAAHIAKARAAASDRRGVKRAGAALRVEVDALSLLLLVAPKTPAAGRRARAFASAVDPPTSGVALAGAVSLGVDADLRGARCFFCCCPAPLAAVSSLRVSGPCVVARQRVAGEPAADSRHVPLGPGRGALLHCAAKGAKAAPKAWVDLALRSEDAAALFGGGLDPSIVLVALAGKRLGPSDPDPGRPRLGNLPWWDMLRLNLRGSLFLEVARFRFDLSASSSPAVCGRSERMRASASAVSLRSSFGEFADLEFRDLALEALGGPPPPPPLPAAAVPRCKLAFVPEASAKIRFGWILPEGRSPEDHHLWPVVRQGEGAEEGGEEEEEGGGGSSEVVAPVDPAVVFAARAIDTLIEFRMRPSSSAPPDAGSSGDFFSSLRPRRPTVWLGGRQVGFTKRLVDALKSPPVWLRLVGRRGTWFAPQDPSRPPGSNLPRLLRAMELDISAEEFVIEHDPPTSSPEALAVLAAAVSSAPAPSADGGGGASSSAPTANQKPAPIRLVSATARYRGSLRLNVPLPPRREGEGGEVPESLSAIARKRELSRTDTLTLLTDVVGENLRLEAPAALSLIRGSSLGAGAPPAGTPIVAMPRLTVRGGRAVPEGLAAAEEDPAPLAAAASLPTSVAFEQARVCGGAEEREAVVELVQDLVASFKAPGRPRPPAAVAADAARRRARAASAARSAAGAGGGGGDPVSAVAVAAAAAAAAAAASIDVTSSLMFASPPAAPSSPVKGAAAAAGGGLSASLSSSSSASVATAPDGGELLKLLLAQQLQQQAAKKGDGGEGSGSESPAAAAAAPPLPPRPAASSSLHASTTGKLPGSSAAGGAGVPLPARPPSYEIFADGIQVCAAASQAPGRVLVRAATARLSGGPPAAAPSPSSSSSAARDASRSALIFEAEGVAAFVALQDVEPRGTVVWLDDEGRVPDNGGGGLVAGSGSATTTTSTTTTTLAFAAGTAPSLIVEPFAFSVRRASASEESQSSSSGAAASGRPAAAPPRPEELAVEMPAVKARAGAAEFAVVVDVGQTMGGSSGGGGASGGGGSTRAPVRSAHSDAALLLSGGSTEGVEVAQAQRRYWAAAQELRSLCGDVAAAAPPVAEVDDGVGALCSPSSSRGDILGRCLPISSNSSNSLSPSRAVDAWTSAATGETAAADAAQALRDHFEEAMVSASASASASYSSAAAPLAAGLAALEARLRAAAAAAIAAAETNAAAADAASKQRQLQDSQRPASAPARATARAAVAADAAVDAATAEAAPAALALWGAVASRSRSAALEASRSRLAAARAAARAAAPARHASFSRVALAGAAWRLLEPDGQPFLDVDLGESVLASESHPDGSGASKLVLRGLSVSDPRRRLKGSPAPGVDVAGGVVVPWNPDASWREDPAARVVARRAPTAAGFAAVYEHVEATLHPLGVHLSDSLASGLWEYFFPPQQTAAAAAAREEEAAAEAAEAAEAAGATGTAAAAVSSSSTRTRRQERFARAIVGTGGGIGSAVASAVGRVPSRGRLGGGEGGGLASPRALSGDEADAEADEAEEGQALGGSSSNRGALASPPAAAAALASAAASAFGKRSAVTAAGRRGRDGGIGAAGERALSPLGAAAEDAAAANAAASPGGEGLVSASVVGLPPRSPSPAATAQASAVAPVRTARPRKVKSFFSLSFFFPPQRNSKTQKKKKTHALLL